jgi:hypothetical protein
MITAAWMDVAGSWIESVSAVGETVAVPVALTEAVGSITETVSVGALITAPPVVIDAPGS